MSIVDAPTIIGKHGGGERMTTKQWLSRALRIDGEIYSLMETRDREKQKLTSITAKLTGDPVQTTHDPHKFDRLVELNAAIDKLIDNQIAIKTEIITAIGLLNKPIYRRILLLKYVDGMTLPAIAEAVHISQRHTERLHGRALVEMGAVINGTYRT